MRGLNLVALFNKKGDRVLMCTRRRDPYMGLINFPGGKIEAGEGGLSAAYRELEEETSVTFEDVNLIHILTFTYPLDECYVEVYAGKLREDIDVHGDENELFWSRLDHNFFDMNKYAGEGNIGHIMEHIRLARKRLEEEDERLTNQK